MDHILGQGLCWNITSVQVCGAVLNGHTRRQSEKPVVIGRGRQDIVLNMGIMAHIFSVPPRKHSFIVIHMKNDRNYCVKNGKKESLREKFKPVSFPTSAQLANHYVKQL